MRARDCGEELANMPEGLIPILRNALVRGALLVAGGLALVPGTASAATGSFDFRWVSCSYVPIWMGYPVEEWQARVSGLPPGVEVEFVVETGIPRESRNVAVTDASGTAVDVSRGLAGGWGSYPVTASALFDADGDGVKDDLVGAPVTVERAPWPCEYVFSGFSKPVARDGKTTTVKAGRTVALNWRVTMPDGTPIDSRAHLVGVLSTATGINGDEFVWDIIWNGTVEELRDDSALTNLGDGRWRYDWRTSRSWAGTKRQLVLWLADGPDTMTRTAVFKFTK
jgi:hypothetical protein